MTWITDENGNRASIGKWGSEEAARASLATLKNCSGCSDCSDCSDCSRCSRCSRCFDCSDCFDCSGCSGCSRCSDCSGCFDCSGCSGCSRCSRCFDCSDCSGCSGCFGCSRCSRCFDCSGCSGCSGKKQDDAVPVPIIENLHAKVYAAASQPKALAMESWHTCETTHCRAGWVTTLAGPAGRALESRFGTLLAAVKIYDASCPDYKINPCRFFDDEESALEDMRKLAGAAPAV